MTATYQTTPMTTVVTWGTSVATEEKDPAYAQAIEDEVYRAMYRAAELEAGLRTR